MRVFCLLVLVGLAAPAGAAEEGVPQRSCIFASAAKLPTIQGLKIVASSTAPMPPEPGKTPDPEMMVVSITVEAAAQTGTFQFACTSGKKGTFVQPVGLTG